MGISFRNIREFSNIKTSPNVSNNKFQYDPITDTGYCVDQVLYGQEISISHYQQLLYKEKNMKIDDIFESPIPDEWDKEMFSSKTSFAKMKKYVLDNAAKALVVLG